MQPSIVFDFDGTLAIGHGPVRAYAQQLAAVAGDDFMQAVDAALAAYDAGDRSYRDGYHVVGSLATERGIDAAALQLAYTESRALLGTAAAPVDTIPELDDFLATLAGSARLFLATNAPATGIDRVLESWGVTDRFAELHFAIGKPAGLTRLIEPLRETGSVLAIGDIAEFDLAPAAALAADTALVGATAATSEFPATMRGATLASLRAEIETWAAHAASSTPAPLGVGSSAETVER